MKEKLKRIFKQALHFFVISGVGWIIDVCIFSIISNWIPIIISNIISSSVSVTYVYFTSTKKIFKNNSTMNLKTKYLIYIIYQICIILLSSFIIGKIGNILITHIEIDFIYKYAKICAKILVTPFTMITNFIFMKLLIEKF